MKAQPDDVFVYIGPLDVKTRPFCYDRVGMVFTRAEIDAMNNGQMPDVFRSAGGWNCRHVFQAVSKVSELRDLVGTGKRMPEVDAARQRMSEGNRRAA